ncbi:MAG: hypothetical protein RI963_1947 [Planctomycetota bacterium]
MNTSDGFNAGSTSKNPPKRGAAAAGTGVRRGKCFAILGQPMLAGSRWAQPQWDATDGMGRETKR